MKKFLISILLVGFVHSFSFARDGSHVGEIRYSILTRDQFRGLYGEEWDLMQGQKLEEDSDLLALWGKERIPDPRGIFLRCSNGERDSGTGNPDGNLDAGAYQLDQFKSHNHIDSGHSHPLFGCGTGVHLPGGTGMAAIDVNSNGLKLGQDAVRGGSAHIQNTGGNETRPRCISVNAFIKLKESPRVNPQVEQSVQAGVHSSAQTLRQWTCDPEFRAAVENVVRAMVKEGL